MILCIKLLKIIQVSQTAAKELFCAGSGAMSTSQVTRGLTLALCSYKYKTSSLWPHTSFPGSASNNGKTPGTNVWRTNFTLFTQLELPYIVKLSAVVKQSFWIGFILVTLASHILTCCQAIISQPADTVEFHSQWSTYWWNVQICRISDKSISVLPLWQTYFSVDNYKIIDCTKETHFYTQLQFMLLLFYHSLIALAHVYLFLSHTFSFIGYF